MVNVFDFCSSQQDFCSNLGGFDMPPARKKAKTGPGPSDGQVASSFAMVGDLQKDVAACVELVQLVVQKMTCLIILLCYCAFVDVAFFHSRIGQTDSSGTACVMVLTTGRSLMILGGRKASAARTFQPR